ncbi:hypothetical protein [Novosphingobium sp. 17-62-19]|uniref:hypothetical protein n=1 Tax=Novosphingobium sp. 17-62-19 TaxID=1970406 RepID=UPI0025F3DEC9|nr:hypothetical protein [Novosphingobium sp. 17-62-19]HQS97635.1 hypothetical protein [Novosphingobium sp.]
MNRLIARFFAMSIVALMLNSCVTTNVGSKAELISVSDFLVRGVNNFDEANSGKIKSIVLFTDANSSKNKKFCEAFVKLAPMNVALSSGVKAEFAPIYWVLKNDVDNRMDCKKILKEYDYQVANIYLQRYGQSASKGPVLVAVDKEGSFAFIDISKANGSDIKKVVFDWANMMRKNGMENISITSPTFLNNLAGLACNTATQIVAVHTPAEGADPTKPETFGFDPATGKWSKPSVYQVGAVLIGGTITKLACGLGSLIT